MSGPHMQGFAVIRSQGCHLVAIFYRFFTVFSRFSACMSISSKCFDGSSWNFADVFLSINGRHPQSFVMIQILLCHLVTILKTIFRVSSRTCPIFEMLCWMFMKFYSYAVLLLRSAPAMQCYLHIATPTQCNSYVVQLLHSATPMQCTQCYS